MDSSSDCEKIRKEMMEENSRKSLYTLMIKLSFWLEIFALNFVEKNLWKGLEKLAQKHSPNLVENNAQTPKFIGLEKLAVGVSHNCRSTVQSTGQRSYSRPLSHRSTGRSTEARRQRASLSVRSTGAFPESRALWTVDRPSCQNWRARLCTSVDHPVDRLKPGNIFLGLTMLTF